MTPVSSAIRAALATLLSPRFEGFSFYGMQALPMLYMVQRLLLPDSADGVYALGALRALLEGGGAPLSDIAFASQIFGLYAGLVNVTPLLGGWLGERLPDDKPLKAVFSFNAANLLAGQKTGRVRPLAGGHS